MYAITRYPASIHILPNKHIFKTLNKAFRFTKPSHTKFVVWEAAVNIITGYYISFWHIKNIYNAANTYGQWIQKLFINAHIFTVRSLGDRDQKKKKKDSQEYKTPWCGDIWSSLGFLSKILNIKAPVSTRCLKPLKNPRHTSQRAPKLFCSSEDTTEQWCFLRITLQVETIQHVKQQWDSP